MVPLGSLTKVCSSVPSGFILLTSIRLATIRKAGGPERKMHIIIKCITVNLTLQIERHVDQFDSAAYFIVE